MVLSALLISAHLFQKWAWHIARRKHIRIFHEFLIFWICYTYRKCLEWECPNKYTNCVRSSKSRYGTYFRFLLIIFKGILNARLDSIESSDDYLINFASSIFCVHLFSWYVEIEISSYQDSSSWLLNFH